MRKATFQITAEHLSTSISACRADNISYILIIYVTKVHKTLQIIPSNFLISNNTFSRFIDKLNVHACPCPTAGGDRQERYFTIESF